MIANQEVDHALHHVGSHRLAWVLAGQDHYPYPFLAIFDPVSGGDRNFIALVMGNCVDESCLGIICVLLIVELDRFQILHQLGVGIREALCKIDSIIVILESVRKFQGVVGLGLLDFLLLKIYDQE